MLYKDERLCYVWVPYVFTSFSNDLRTRHSGYTVWVPYVFTSFSNFRSDEPCPIWVWVPYVFTSFSNVNGADGIAWAVWVPYVFTSFSNSYLFGNDPAIVWVPYVFTSFSNLKVQKCSASSAPGMVLKRFLANTTFVTINYTVISLFWKVALYIFNQQQCNFAVHA